MELRSFVSVSGGSGDVCVLGKIVSLREAGIRGLVLLLRLPAGRMAKNFPRWAWLPWPNFSLALLKRNPFLNVVPNLTITD